MSYELGDPGDRLPETIVGASPSYSHSIPRSAQLLHGRVLLHRRLPERHDLQLIGGRVHRCTMEIGMPLLLRFIAATSIYRIIWNK